jgi:hypothetical protein
VFPGLAIFNYGKSRVYFPSHLGVGSNTSLEPPWPLEIYMNCLDQGEDGGVGIWRIKKKENASRLGYSKKLRVKLNIIIIKKLILIYKL